MGLSYPTRPGLASQGLSVQNVGLPFPSLPLILSITLGCINCNLSHVMGHCARGGNGTPFLDAQVLSEGILKVHGILQITEYLGDSSGERKIKCFLVTN